MEIVERGGENDRGEGRRSFFRRRRAWDRVVELDKQKLILEALPKLVEGLSPGRFEDAARAIMTTDLVMKTAFAEVKGARIAGMTKGSGMIHPRMATTLAFVMTDAVMAPDALRTALKRACEKTFNRIPGRWRYLEFNDSLAILADRSVGRSSTCERV